MSVEALLTLATLVLAIFALIPRERAEDLRIRLGRVPVAVTVAAGLLVIYWALLEQIHSLPLLSDLPRPIRWWRNWTSPTASLIALLFAAIIAWFSYRRALPVSRVPRLARSVTDSLARGRFGEALHLIDTHLRTISKALDGDYWRERLRVSVLPTPGEQFIRAQRSGTRRPEATQATQVQLDNATINEPGDVLDAETVLRIIAVSRPKPAGAISRWFTNFAATPKDTAQDLVRSISQAPAFISEIASAHPYLGLRLLHLNSSWLIRDFAESYARALFGNPNSVLYREVRRAENIDSDGIIYVDTHEQPLLSALCADVARSDGPRLLYTFLEAGIEPLRWGQTDLRRRLNGPIADFHERGRWTSPPFAAVYLLEIVVPRVSVDPDESLLNLYVVRTFTDVLLSGLSPQADVDLSREWPTPTHYLIYEAVSLLSDTVLIAKDRLKELRQVVEAKKEGSASATLPDHAIDVLGSVMHACLRSDRLDGRFKGYLLQIWWSAYSDKYAGDWDRSKRILEALVRGGAFGGGDMSHRAGMAEALQHVDPMIAFSRAADNLRAGFELPTLRSP